MVTIKKGNLARERKEKQTDSALSRTKAIEDYNIMMGNLEDPMEGEE